MGIAIVVHGQALHRTYQDGLGLAHLGPVLTVFEQAHQGVLHQVLDFFALTAVTGQDAPRFLHLGDRTPVPPTSDPDVASEIFAELRCLNDRTDRSKDSAGTTIT